VSGWYLQSTGLVVLYALQHTLNTTFVELLTRRSFSAVYSRLKGYCLEDTGKYRIVQTFTIYSRNGDGHTRSILNYSFISS
jgi:hypothetical protein